MLAKKIDFLQPYVLTTQQKLIIIYNEFFNQNWKRKTIITIVSTTSFHIVHNKEILVR